MKQRLPEIFRPLMWSFRWEDLDPDEDCNDIIINTLNEGTLEHWRWIIQYYGKPTIRSVLRKRLVTEFHPESLHLVRLIFGLSSLRHAR